MTAKSSSKAMQKAPTGAFCIAFELLLAVTCLLMELDLFNEWSLNTDRTAACEKKLSPDDVIENLGGCGRFQWFLSFTIQAMKLVVCWGMVGNSFFAFTPTWRCVDDITLENSSLTITMMSLMTSNASLNATYAKETWETKTCKSDLGTECKTFDFSNSIRTFVSEFGLVCDWSWVPATITSIQMGGMALGSIVSGQIADTWGRKLPLYLSMALLGIFHTLSYFSTSWVMLAVCRVFIGIGSAFFLTIYSILQSEYAVSQWRSVMVSFPSWPLEAALFALVAWQLPDWKYLTIIMSILSVVFIVVCWFVPESFRWFIAKNRYQEAEAALKIVANMNGKSVPDFQSMRIDTTGSKAEIEAKKYSFMVLFSRLNLLKLTIPLIIIWLTMGLVSYGIIFGIQQLSGNIYLNIFLFSIASLPAKVASIYLQNKFGRRKASMMSLSMCLLGGLTVGLVQYIDTPYRAEVTTYCALVANMAMDGTWGPIQTLTLEVYPTVVRNTGFGFASVMSRVGAMIGPQFVFLNEVVPGLLYFMVATLSLLSIVGVSTLPETMDMNLVDKLNAQTKQGSDQGKTENKL